MSWTVERRCGRRSSPHTAPWAEVHIRQRLRHHRAHGRPGSLDGAGRRRPSIGSTPFGHARGSHSFDEPGGAGAETVERHPGGPLGRAWTCLCRGATRCEGATTATTGIGLQGDEAQLARSVCRARHQASVAGAVQKRGDDRVRIGVMDLDATGGVAHAASAAPAGRHGGRRSRGLPPAKRGAASSAGEARAASSSRSIVRSA